MLGTFLMERGKKYTCFFQACRLKQLKMPKFTAWSESTFLMTRPCSYLWWIMTSHILNFTVLNNSALKVLCYSIKQYTLMQQLFLMDRNVDILLITSRSQLVRYNNLEKRSDSLFMLLHPKKLVKSAYSPNDSIWPTGWESSKAYMFVTSWSLMALTSLLWIHLIYFIELGYLKFTRFIDFYINMQSNETV